MRPPSCYKSRAPHHATSIPPLRSNRHALELHRRRRETLAPTIAARSVVLSLHRRHGLPTVFRKTIGSTPTPLDCSLSLRVILAILPTQPSHSGEPCAATASPRPSPTLSLSSPIFALSPCVFPVANDGRNRRWVKIRRGPCFPAMASPPSGSYAGDPFLPSFLDCPNPDQRPRSKADRGLLLSSCGFAKSPLFFCFLTHSPCLNSKFIFTHFNSKTQIPLFIEMPPICFMLKIFVLAPF